MAVERGYRGRFAPSPTGLLHFGSLVAALGSYLRAKSQGGRWLVRIEDIDPPRTVPGAAALQLETLARFGLVSDEPVVFQSQRAERYETALARLTALGLTYECRCSRSELAPFNGRHPPHCMATDATRPAAIRVRGPDAAIGFDDIVQGRFEQNLAAAVGDFVVKRADGEYAYQLAVVVDDAEQGITEVVRGADLLDSTPRQIWLQRVLGLPTPAYLHLPLALDNAGQKMSKSQGAAALDVTDPMPALCAALAFLGQADLSSSRSPLSLLAQAAAYFRIEAVPSCCSAL